MRLFFPAIAAMLFFGCCSPSNAVITVSRPGQCSDKNALQSIAIDARLVAVKLYYEGFVQNIPDKNRQICYEAHVLMDDHFAVINRTRVLVETECLPIDIAAKKATEGLCP